MFILDLLNSSGATLQKYSFSLPRHTPSSHTKNSLSKICSKGWVAQKSLFDRQWRKICQGLGPKRAKYWIANWVHAASRARLLDGPGCPDVLLRIPMRPLV